MTKLDLNDNGVTMSKLATISLLVVAIVTIGLLSIYAMANNDINSHQQQVLAQEEEDDGEDSSSSPSTAEVIDTIAQRGTLSSSQDPLRGHESHQATVILPPRDDGGLYSGVLTYTASVPVEVAVIQAYDLDNVTTAEIPEEFGAILTSPAPWSEGDTVTPLMMSVDYANSPTISSTTPFVGNVLALHTSTGEPFVATYSVVADVYQPEVVSNVESALNATSTASPN
jgi:hypothetical protein